MKFVIETKQIHDLFRTMLPVSKERASVPELSGFRR